MGRGRLSGQRRRKARQSGRLEWQKPLGSRIPKQEGRGLARLRAAEDEGNGGRGSAVENLKFRSDERRTSTIFLAFCLVWRSLVSTAVHLRSTNLSIVPRQISGNITDMFRHEPPPFLSSLLIRCPVVSSRSILPAYCTGRDNPPQPLPSPSPRFSPLIYLPSLLFLPIPSLLPSQTVIPLPDTTAFLPVHRKLFTREAKQTARVPGRVRDTRDASRYLTSPQNP